MVVTAHHDNSANNPTNPAPDQAAAWGEMTSQEMMLPWFGVVVGRAAQPEKLRLTGRAILIPGCSAPRSRSSGRAGLQQSVRRSSGRTGQCNNSKERL